MKSVSHLTYSNEGTATYGVLGVPLDSAISPTVIAYGRADERA
jgi:hypothetical protein